MELKSIVIAALLGATGGFCSLYHIMSKQNSQIQARLNQIPPVVVVDFAKVVASYPEGASQSEIEKLMVQTNDAIFRLKEAGYLVLDGGSILGAPKDVYLPVGAREQ